MSKDIIYKHKDTPIYDISIYDQPAFPIPPGVEMELVGISKQELAELRKRLKKTQELELEIRRENAKLKGLLKECRDEINPYRDFASSKRTFKNLINKINQALGEDK